MPKWGQPASEAGGRVSLITIPKRKELIERLPIARKDEQLTRKILRWRLLIEEIFIRCDPVFILLY